VSEAFLISLREGFEAVLVISILLGYARRLEDSSAARWIWVGIGGALAVASAAGLVLHSVVGGFTGDARTRTFAVTCLAAGALLTWMIFWMAANGRTLKSHLEGRASEAMTGGSVIALVALAFTAVVREGLETALFLLSASASSDGAAIAMGTVLGLAAASVLGVLIYRGAARIDVRRFFQVTGVLIILFAAGLAAKTVFLFQASGDLGSLNDAVWDLTSIEPLTVASQLGRFLAGIFGWDPRPSIEQAAAYFAYLVPVGLLYLRATQRRPIPVAARTGGLSDT
jgi:high-affinity iron transporter